MKFHRTLAVFFGLLFLYAASCTNARADAWDKTTKVTFSEPVQVPGTDLPAGTYIFRLADNQSYRHIVQIFNEDRSKLMATIIAIPNYRLEPTDKPVLTFDERPADQPVALQAWFYPGDNVGQEFAYPKRQAEMLSRLNHREVPTDDGNEANAANQPQTQQAAPENQAATTQPPAESQPETPSPRTESAPAPSTAQQNQTPSTPTEQANPAPEPTPAPQQNPSANQPAPQTQRELPHTASALPLIALAGLLCLGLALTLRMAVRP
jgi:hypothetical protein